MALIHTTFLILRPGLVPARGSAPLPVEPSYQDIKALVEPYLDGGRMEHVAVLHNGRRSDMFVDEIGIQKGLPRNERATAIYRAATLAREPQLDPEHLSCIYGPAVVFDRLVWL